MFRRCFATLLLASAVAATPMSTAISHPHEFVTMKIQVAFDKAGRMVGMRYNWTFDEFFSAYALEPFDENGNREVEQSESDALLADVLNNIAEIDYFTKFDEKSTLPELDKAIPVSSSFDNRQVTLVFDVPFKKALDVSVKPLRYAIYDEQFFIAMNHVEGDDAVSLAGTSDGCTSDIAGADPSDDIEAFASSLGRDESGGDELGAAFAEWVTIKCS
ncbi:DUF1007 family protein [Ahrensia sp. R2A130]|uniref:DUF1007 family protein n=1 Tax=Ahrensia sp. R2A130 TaxID=744979 RepID=UPI0001E0D116|nr:DUF1007 family protein [Ahrensia sp. R2A130]EFL88867.1 conserved hypothetical protein [Ahrensia sp. R2A130]